MVIKQISKQVNDLRAIKRRRQVRIEAHNRALCIMFMLIATELDIQISWPLYVT